MEQPDLAIYEEHRTGIQIDRLLTSGRVIPSWRIAAHVERNFPGWNWGDLYSIFRAAGIVDASTSPPRCDPAVKAIHFGYDGSWTVERLVGGVIDCTNSNSTG